MIKRSINIKGELHSFDKPLVMGIVNMTPDSFFDGGKYNNLDQNVFFYYGNIMISVFFQ